MRWLFHLATILILTILTQIGGLAWLASRFFRRKTWVFIALYAGLSIGAVFVAPLFGRVALPCSPSAMLKMLSPIYCTMNRQYVTPALKAHLTDLSDHMAATHTGTKTQVLDANFPFFDGFPLLPHLSHSDGRKVDLAFFYLDTSGQQTDKTPSPLGYFAFEQGQTHCPKAWPTLRWDMGWLQPLWPDLTLDEIRTKTALRWLVTTSSIEKVFVEPHLKDRMSFQSSKIRFQGCRAARHDDHIHLQISAR